MGNFCSKKFSKSRGLHECEEISWKKKFKCRGLCIVQKMFLKKIVQVIKKKHTKFEQSQSIWSELFLGENFLKKIWGGGGNFQDTVEKKPGECHNEAACQVWTESEHEKWHRKVCFEKTMFFGFFLGGEAKILKTMENRPRHRPGECHNEQPCQVWTESEQGKWHM